MRRGEVAGKACITILACLSFGFSESSAVEALGTDRLVFGGTAKEPDPALSGNHNLNGLRPARDKVPTSALRLISNRIFAQHSRAGSGKRTIKDTIPDQKTVMNLEGVCEFRSTGEKFRKCDDVVVVTNFRKDRATIEFKAQNTIFSMSGRREPDATLSNYKQSVNSMIMLNGGKVLVKNNHIQGLCHLKLRKFSHFKSSIGCSIRNPLSGKRIVFRITKIRSIKNIPNR